MSTIRSISTVLLASVKLMAKPLNMRVSYFDRRIVPFISREIAEHSIYHYLENELKLKLVTHNEKLSFAMQTKKEKRQLILVSMTWL